MLSNPEPDKKYAHLMHVSTSSSNIFLLSMTSQNDVSLCKLDVNEKKRTAVADGVG